MVSKPVALAGSAMSLVSVVMVVIVAVSENFVVVELPPVEACSENYLGKLGIYTATFDPACTVGSAAEDSYSVFEKSNGPTTSFWPLFPAQEGFGGALASLGITADSFTTCEEFYAEDGPFATAAAYAGTSGVFEVLDAAFTEQYEELTETVDTVFTGIPTGLNGYINDVFADSLVEGLTTVQQGFGLAYATLSAAKTELDALSCEASSSPSEFGVGYSALECTSAPAWMTEVNSGGFALGQFFTASAGFFGEDFIKAASAFANPLTSYTSISDAYADSAVLAQTLSAEDIENFYTAMSLPGAPVAVDSLTTVSSLASKYGGILATTIDTAADLSSIKVAILTYDGALRTMSSYGLSPLAALFSFLCDTDVIDTCPEIELDFPALNDGAEYPLCVVASESDVYAATELGDIVEADATACTFYKFLNATATAEVLTVLGSALVPTGADAATAEALLASFITAAPGLQEALATGAFFGLTLDQLAVLLVNPGAAFGFGAAQNYTTTEEQGLVPAFLGAKGYGLCTGLKLQASPFVCDAEQTFGSFIEAAKNASVATGSDTAASLTVANTIVNTICGTDMDRATCIGTVYGLKTLGYLDAGVSSFLTAAVSTQLPGGAATTEERIANCEDDNTDKEKFETAQKMLASSIAMIAVGFLVAAAGAVTLKGPVALGGGFFSLLGGLVLLGALLVVRSAPVYAEVGGEKEDYETYYAAAVGQIIAIAAMALAVVGGIVTMVSACLNRGASAETAVANGKVDTY